MALFKIGMSLVFAFVAAMVIMLAGLLSDARMVTVLLRSLIGFFVAGVCVWLAAMILEHQNIVGFDKNLELPDSEVPDELKSPEELEAEDKEAAANQQESEAVTEDNTGENTGFTPLSQDNLKHMEPPADS